MGDTLFIVNPGASGGQGELAWHRFRELWPETIDSADVRVTEHPGHGTEIAASVWGYNILGVVGGDGSVNEVCNGLLRREGDRPALAIIPTGTGNDIARANNFFPLENAVEALRAGFERPHDIFRCNGREGDRTFTSYGLLSSNIGFSGAPLTRPWMKKLFGATLTYLLTTLAAILTHRPPTMSIRWDGETFKGRTWMVICANVESVSGGSMKVAPGAKPVNGKLWVTICEPKPKLTMLLKALPKVASGEHIKLDGFHYFSTEEIEIAVDRRTVIDLDGETGWVTGAKLAVLPGAIRLVTPEQPA